MVHKSKAYILSDKYYKFTNTMMQLSHESAQCFPAVFIHILSLFYMPHY